MKRFVFALAIALMVSGCATVRKAEPTGLAAEAFWKDQAARRAHTEAISAKLRLGYRAKEERISGKGRLLAQDATRLRIELRDPLGRVQYVATLDGKRFQALVPSQKRLYVDEAGGQAYLKHFLALDLPFRSLQRLFVGVIPDVMAVKAFRSWEWNGSEGAYVGEAPVPGGVLRAIVDPHTAALRKLRWERKNDTVNVDYGDFSRCCESGSRISFAYSVAVRLEKAGSEVAVDWDDVEPVRGAKSADVFRILPASGVQTVRLP